jgi:cytochrome c5
MLKIKRVYCLYFLLTLSLIGCAKSVEDSTKVNKNTISKEESLFNKSCVSCHLSGVAGAPKKGDAARWNELLENKGMKDLLQSVTRGLGAMPAKGMCPTCSQEDFENIILWMAGVKSKQAVQ